MVRGVVFVLLSLVIHAVLAGVLAWCLTTASEPEVLATLDLSSVELSFAETECDSAPVAALPPAPPETASPAPTVETPPVPDLVADDSDIRLSAAEPELTPAEAPLEKMETPPEKVEPPVAQSETPPAAAPRQARVEAPPRPTRKIRPDYPRRARQRGEQGNVVLEIEVAADGSVSSVSVASSSGHPDLDAAALKAVREARFEPARAGGVAVAAAARIQLKFQLK